MWQRTKHGSKSGFDKLWGWADKLAAPASKPSNKLDSDAFWPTTLDKECDKAARILRSFCKDGFCQEEGASTTPDGLKQTQKVLRKIPPEVIQNAKGLAIFTTMRSGLWVSDAGGCGVIVGRTEDGSWSSPSGIMLHTEGLGFLIGADIYDCVVVMNTQDALDAFSQLRYTVGADISAVAGPLGADVHEMQAPIFTYVKSRGVYAGVQMDGTVVIERTDENARFYREQIGAVDIVAGKARNPPYDITPLMETIRAAQGDTDVVQSLLPDGPPPGDYELEADGHTFGIPDKLDPDPYGVLALEKEGLHIVEAGTHKRPTSEQFEFNPSPQSPIYSTFSRRSISSLRDSKNVSRRSSWRTSSLSTATNTDRTVQTCDMSTQTDLDSPVVISPTVSEPNGRGAMAEIPENDVLSVPASQNAESSVAAPTTEQPKDVAEESSKDEKPEEQPEVNAVSTYDEDDVALEEPVVVHQIQQTAAPQAIRARLVTVTKPTPPRLPPRNPIRNRKGPLIIDASPTNADGTREVGTSPRTPRTPRTPPSSSEPPSLSTMGSASPGSSRESVSSDEHMEAMNNRLSKIMTIDGEERRRQKEESVERDSEEFHSVPVTPEQRTRSPSRKISPKRPDPAIEDAVGTVISGQRNATWCLENFFR